MYEYTWLIHAQEHTLQHTTTATNIKMLDPLPSFAPLRPSSRPSSLSPCPHEDEDEAGADELREEDA